MIYSINNYPILSHENINTYISDYDIYSFYLGSRFKIGQAFNSPFHKDKTPSFAIHEINNGKLLFKDFAKGLNGNVIGFVKELYNLSTDKEAALKIYSDLIENKSLKKLENVTIKREYTRKTIDIGVTRQDFTKEDIEWWDQFNITEDILNIFEVNSIKYMFIGPYIKHTYSITDPMYSYKVYDKVKIYRPISKKTEKWYGNLTRNYIHGFKQLPDTGDLLIITKSLKDVMCLYSLGYTAISPSSEGTLIPDHIIKQLKKRFKNIIIFYDNDEAGINYSKRMNIKYNLPQCKIAECEEAKDTSDFFKKYKEKQTKDYLKWMFENTLVSEINLIQNEKENKKEKRTTSD